ncbi:hypothetical protein [Natronolimnohabitans innermongolicus]|nr:hypothetical protein [Natronolimnohabitans innermongolicus]
MAPEAHLPEAHLLFVRRPLVLEPSVTVLDSHSSETVAFPLSQRW